MTAARPSTPLRKKLLFSAVAVVGALLILEGVARIVEAFRPTRAVDYGLGFDADSRVFAPSPDRPGFVVTAPGKDLFFRPQTFSVAKARGTFRVVALGGSSIYRMQDEFRVLEEHLEAAAGGRNVDVIDAGGLSYGSARLVGVALEMLQYDPDVVLLHEGNNEFTEMQQYRLASLETLALQRAVTRSAAVRFFADFVADREVAAVRAQMAEERRRVGATPSAFSVYGYPTYPVDQAEEDARMKAYHDNFAFIVGLCRARGVPIVISTVPSNLVHPALPDSARAAYAPVEAMLREGRYDEARALGRSVLAGPICRHQASDAENGVVRRLAQELSIPLADVEEAVVAAEPHHVPGETLFSDHCHLNARGNVVLRETYERILLDMMRAKLGSARPTDGR